LGVGPDGTVHIAWHDYTDYDDAGSDYDIFYKMWEPGTGWGTTEVISTESTGNSANPSLGVGPYGTVHIAWFDETDYDDAGSGYDIFYKGWRRVTGWGTTEVVSTESTGNSEFPSLGVGPDGTVHIAWYDYTDYDDAGWGYDIFYKRWEPGRGWGTTEVVSTESTTHSKFPSLGVGPDGTVHIAWHERSDYDASGSDYDIFYKRFWESPWSPRFSAALMHAVAIGILSIMGYIIHEKYPDLFHDPTEPPRWNRINILMFAGAITMLISSTLLFYFQPTDLQQVFLGGTAYGIGTGLAYTSLIQHILALRIFHH